MSIGIRYWLKQTMAHLEMMPGLHSDFKVAQVKLTIPDNANIRYQTPSYEDKDHGTDVISYFLCSQ